MVKRHNTVHYLRETGVEIDCFLPVPGGQAEEFLVIFFLVVVRVWLELLPPMFREGFLLPFLHPDVMLPAPVVLEKTPSEFSILLVIKIYPVEIIESSCTICQ